MTTNPFDTHRYDTEAALAEIQAIIQTEQGIFSAHFGDVPSSGSCFVLIPKCVCDCSRRSGKGLVGNVPILKDVKTHKK